MFTIFNFQTCFPANESFLRLLEISDSYPVAENGPCSNKGSISQLLCYSEDMIKKIRNLQFI